jgi:pilus assembly protein TadC
MTETPPGGRADAAMAGGLLIGAIVVCAAAGFGLGSLVGLAVPLGLVGLFAGLVAGFALVYARYRRL